MEYDKSYEIEQINHREYIINATIHNKHYGDIRPVIVLFQNNYIQVMGDSIINANFFSYFSYYDLIDCIVSLLTSRREIKKEGKEENWLRDNKIRSWAEKQTAKAINCLFHSTYLKEREITSKIFPDKYELQKKFFSYTLREIGRETLGILDHTPYLIQDLTKYRSCASFFACFDQFYLMSDNNLEEQLERTLYNSTMNLFQFEKDWRRMIFGSEPNKFMNLTLDNYPGGIPPKVIKNGLRGLRLDRAITDRIEMMGTMAINNRVAILYAREKSIFSNLIHKSTRNDYLRAMELWVNSQQVIPEIPKRIKYNHLTEMCAFALDFPEDHNGNIYGLMEKSIQWHRDIHIRRLEEEKKRIEELKYQRAAKPPIAIPKTNNAEIKFLEKYEDFLHEGEEMQHCIGAYFGRATDGYGYYFHVEYKGEKATVEVNPFDGSVYQAYGPHNKKNAATSFAVRLFSKWGNELKKHEERNLGY